MNCFFLPKYAPCYVQLGKFGDIMILLPGLYRAYQETGKKSVLLVSSEYGSILEGVSYVQPWIENFQWVADLGRARRLAESRFGWAIVPKWWDDPNNCPPPPLPSEPFTVLRYDGREIKLPIGQWDSYQLSQWRAAGFNPQEIVKWPLIFDRRNRKRELELVDKVLGKGYNSRAKILLVNMFGGGSSPFGFDSEVWQLLRAYQGVLKIVDLARVRASRIYDLLGLMERASGMITSDTSTLHLASATSMPYIAFIANGGGGSITRGNCQLEVRYQDTLRRLEEVRQQLDKWL